MCKFFFHYFSNDKIIEVSHANLVGRYLGETSIKTLNKLNEALGHVLFIDEAYELAIDHGTEGSFGDQAITALIDEMESNVGKLCVILAGYEYEIDKLIAANAGFSSRIRKYMYF